MNRAVAEDDSTGGMEGSDDDAAFSGLPIPTRGSVLLGKYRVEGVVGVGGMGMVIAARHLHLNERVAVKLLLPKYAAIQETRKRFEREAQAAYKLRSEHVCRVLDAGELEDGTPFIAMEFLKGDDLHALIRKEGRLPVGTAVDLILQVCEALGEAHSNGIVHRDLKPANLVVVSSKDGSRSVKVIDFGISKVANQGSSLTNTFGYLGSPSYSAPEQFSSARATTASGDIWSLGIILYEMIIGELPFVFPGDSLAEVASTLAHDPPVPMGARHPSIDPELERAVMTCLAKDPQERHPRVRELAEAIARFAASPTDEVLARLRRHQPGEARARADSAPRYTSPANAPIATAQTAPLARAPLPSGTSLPSELDRAQHALPAQGMPVPQGVGHGAPYGDVHYGAVAGSAISPGHRSHRSLWAPAALGVVAIIFAGVTVAAYRSEQARTRAPGGTASGTATGTATSPPTIEATSSGAPPVLGALATGTTEPTPSAVASSSSSSTPPKPVPTTRHSGSGRGGPTHRPSAAPAESGPKILTDRDGK